MWSCISRRRSGVAGRRSPRRSPVGAPHVVAFVLGEDEAGDPVAVDVLEAAGEQVQQRVARHAADQPVELVGDRLPLLARQAEVVALERLARAAPAARGRPGRRPVRPSSTPGPAERPSPSAGRPASPGSRGSRCGRNRCCRRRRPRGRRRARGGSDQALDLEHAAGPRAARRPADAEALQHLRLGGQRGAGLEVAVDDVADDLPGHLRGELLVRRGFPSVRRRRGPLTTPTLLRAPALARVLAPRTRRTSPRRRGRRARRDLQAPSGSAPESSCLTGTSSSLPVSVRGTAGTATTSSGTWRGEQARRSRRAISSPSPASSSAPGREDQEERHAAVGGGRRGKARRPPARPRSPRSRAAPRRSRRCRCGSRRG